MLGKRLPNARELQNENGSAEVVLDGERHCKCGERLDLIVNDVVNDSVMFCISAIVWRVGEPCYVGGQRRTPRILPTRSPLLWLLTVLVVI